jgi:general secretion pathway protein J
MWQRWAGPAVTTTTALQSSWLATQQFQGNEPGQLRALGGIDQWQVYFYQGNAWANCQSTGNVAATASSAPPGVQTQQALPSGVRIVLAFAPGSGMNGSLTRDTLIAP